MVIIPMMQIYWTIFSIISGLLYFQERRTLVVTTRIVGNLIGTADNPLAVVPLI